MPVKSDLGVVLENGGKPVAFASKRWTQAEAKKSTTERELNAMIFGIKKFSYFLKGAKFKAITDHKPLMYIRGKRNAEEHLKEKMIRHGDYDFEIEYRSGKEIAHADALSRKPVRRIEVAEADFVEAIEEDGTMKAVRDGLISDEEWRSDDPELKFYQSDRAKLTVVDGIVWRFPGSEMRGRLFCQLSSAEPSWVSLMAIPVLDTWVLGGLWRGSQHTTTGTMSRKM